MMKKIQMTNLLGLDIYRILCCLGVLIYHVCDDYLVDNGNLFLWYSAAFCIPGFFLMSGYLIGIKESISLEYCENKILQNLKRLLGYVILWAVIFYILNNNFYNILDELEKGALSQGILPVSWFLFTWSFFMISAYPLKKLLEKHPILFISLSLLFMLSLEFRTTIFSKGILSTLGRTQSLWIDIYFPYFMFGMSLGKILSFKLQTTNYKLQTTNYKLQTTNYKLYISIIFLSLVSYLYYINISFFHKVNLFPSDFYTKWYYSIWVVLMFLVFILFDKFIVVSNQYIRFIINKCANGTFCVYMMHLPLLIIFTKSFTIVSIYSALIYIACLFISCIILGMIFKTLPLLRKL